MNVNLSDICEQAAAKCKTFISFPDVEIFWKRPVFAEFWANSYRNNFSVHALHGFF